jgi:hypothetical protein
MADPVKDLPIVESTPASASVGVVLPEPAPSPGVGGAEVPAGVAAPVEEAPKLDPSLFAEFDAAHPDKKVENPAAPAPDADKPAADPDAAAKPVVDAAKPAAEGEIKPAEVAPTPLAPVKYEYTVPETLSLPEAERPEIEKVFDAFRADPAKGVQGLVDLHAQKMADFAAATLKNQYSVFNDTRKSWRQEVMSDPLLGGSGFQTSMGAIARMRDQFVADKDRGAFNKMLEITGVGDHPQFLKLLLNVARAYDEPPLPTPNIAPTPNQGQPPKRGLRAFYNSNREG